MTFTVENGALLCSACKAEPTTGPDRAALQKEWEGYVERMKAERVRLSRRYDAAMAYSGGKESTAALYLCVKEYGLEILVWTIP